MLAKHFLNRVVWCAEALCRGGVGTLVLIDGDVVDSTNRNRQLPALHSTLGNSKVDVRHNISPVSEPFVNMGLPA